MSKLKFAGLLLFFAVLCESVPAIKKIGTTLKEFKHIHVATNKIKTGGTCLGCAGIISIIQHSLRNGGTEEEVGILISDLCNAIHFEKPSICAALGTTMKHELHTALVHTPYQPQEICALLQSECGLFLHPSHNWTVPLPPAKPDVQPPRNPKAPLKLSRVLHLSDLHTDFRYKTGSNANCDQLLCCRAVSGKPPTSSDAAGYWGDYRNCDIPMRTVENTLAHIQKNHKFDYVIWTGDDQPHDYYDYTRAGTLTQIHAVTKLVHKYLGNVPIFPSLGNHDSAPFNSFPIPQIKGKDSVSWLYNELAEDWQRLLKGKASLSTIKKGAYYSVLINPGLRLISINTNYCNRFNAWLLIDSDDPADQLKWLAAELQKAEEKGEKVHIIGHIPPGLNWCIVVWSSNYNRIINRYENTVTAQFFAHTHKDEFEVFYEKSGPVPRATSIAYIGPSVTTYTGLNPSYRIYTVDGSYPGSSRVVLDHETYFMNLTASNALGTAVWEFEYSAKEAYQMESLLPKDWDRLTERFVVDEELFQKFYKFFSHSSDFFPRRCSTSCKKGILCNLRRSQSNDLRKC